MVFTERSVHGGIEVGKVSKNRSMDFEVRAIGDDLEVREASSLEEPDSDRLSERRLILRGQTCTFAIENMEPGSFLVFSSTC